MKQMKDTLDMDQDIPREAVTKEGVHLKLIGRGNSKIKEDVEKLIGELRFYKITRGQIIEGLNGSSPYMDYYLSEDDIEVMELYYKDGSMAMSA